MRSDHSDELIYKLVRLSELARTKVIIPKDTYLLTTSLELVSRYPFTFVTIESLARYVRLHGRGVDYRNVRLCAVKEVIQEYFASRAVARSLYVAYDLPASIEERNDVYAEALTVALNCLTSKRSQYFFYFAEPVTVIPHVVRFVQ